MKKRGVIISDLHCGHLVGLTPPAYQIKPVRSGTSKRTKWSKIQDELWRAYVKMLKQHGPFDFCLYAGDGIDGSGKRSGGSELITTDIEEQCNMATECIDQIRLHAKRGFKVVGCYGTPYHCGEIEDSENHIAKQAGFDKIGSHEWVDVNGCIIDLKHHIGSSSIPHGRHTAIARDRLQNLLWAERDQQPRANILLRGHCHFHNFCGGPNWTSITLPALQAAGTKYGARRCSGIVDWGMTFIEVDNDGGFDWCCDTIQFKTQKAEVVKI